MKAYYTAAFHIIEMVGVQSSSEREKSVVAYPVSKSSSDPIRPFNLTKEMGSHSNRFSSVYAPPKTQ